MPVEELGQRVDRALAAQVAVIREVLALRRLHAGQLLERHALLAGEALRGR